MTPDASHASPSNSANLTTNLIKEKFMSSEAMSAASAVAGSSASTAHPEGKMYVVPDASSPGTGPGTTENPGKKKRIVDRYGTTIILTKAAAALKKVKDVKHALITTDVTEVDAAIERVKRTKLELSAASEQFGQAQLALKALGAPVGYALTPIAPLLQRRTIGGRAVYRECKVNDDFTTATSLLEKASLRGMGIDPHLVGKLEAAVDAARAAATVRKHAQEADQRAKDALVEAKRSLIQAITRLNASHAWVKRHGPSLAPSTVVPPQSKRGSRGPKRN